jgi:hypothetical protein
VWTGKNIPSEFLEDLKAYREEKAEMASLQELAGMEQEPTAWNTIPDELYAC